MKPIIAWAARNSPAMNTLMIGTLLVGVYSLMSMRREVFPEFELEIVLVTVPYPGASPEEVEEGVCQKIEESIRSVDHIRKITSVAREGTGFVVIELNGDVPDAQKVLNEIRSEVDRIPSFPELAEDPEVKQITFREAAIKVGVIGPDDESQQGQLSLRAIAEEIRDDLLQLKEVSQANLVGARDYQIDIEMSEETLRKHGLTLQQVAQIVRRENVELSGGRMKTDAQEVLLRSKSKGTVGEEIAQLPLVTRPNGVVLTVGDLGVVRDEFVDETAIHRVEGMPAMVISVDRTTNEDLLAMVQTVKDYVQSKQMPEGYSLRTWQDRSVDVRDRMELLARNGIQGLILVFLVLAVFLELRLAFWVALGVPMAVLGACIVLFFTGETLNMLSMFAFLMALGIVVDDAIVIGENIHAHRQRKEEGFHSAVQGAYEVLPAVVASVTTTIIAFAPLLFVAGIMGKFIAVMPVAVIAMLVISLIESTLILPCHLAHPDNLFFKLVGKVFFFLGPVLDFSVWVNQQAQRGIEFFVNRIYLPALAWTLRNPFATLSGAATLLLLTLGLYTSGIAPWILFPKMDSNWINAKITFPDGTPGSVTDAATRRLEEALRALDEQQQRASNSKLVTLVHRSVGLVTSGGVMGPDSRSTGSHVGMVDVELVDTSRRNMSSDQILAQWRAVALQALDEDGSLAGVDSLTFGTPDFGPRATPIEFKLVADKEQMESLNRAVEICRDDLARRAGVFDVRDDSLPGKWEFQLTVKEKAKAMGVTAADLAETVRASYFGEEVMRLQRGRHEVKLMVRYPRSERKSLADFERLRVRTGDGAERPLTELAQVEVRRGYAEINRIEQKRAITISADLDEQVANASVIVADMQKNLLPKLKQEFPEIDVRWEGEKERSQESLNSLGVGFLVAVVSMFMLLTVVFRSYIQPLIILAIIPFGVAGAVWGHVLLQLPLTLFTMFGMVALTGVVVNDSIVLVDYINRRIRGGFPLDEALMSAGARRFRPVFLTSLTTIAGLSPMLLETSFQAQILIPMAAAIVFGLMLASTLILFLVPVFYRVYALLVRVTLGEEPLEDQRDQTEPAAARAQLAEEPTIVSVSSSAPVDYFQEL